MIASAPQNQRHLPHTTTSIICAITQDFCQNLQPAANAVFPNKIKSRYSRISVLMLSWADEAPQLPVSRDIESLFRVFQDFYKFETEHLAIPDVDSHYKLTEKFMQFVRSENRLREDESN